MVRRNPRFPHFLAFKPVVIAAISLVAFVLWNPRVHTLRAKTNFRKQENINETHSWKGATEASSAILLDSIVSLVQSYYVDSDRVSGDFLISGTMRSIAYAIPELKFVDDDVTYSLSWKSEKLEFNHSAEMEYDEVLGHLKSLISFCQRVDIPELMAEGENLMLGSEHEPTTIVLNALLSSLDAHSSLMSKEAYQELRQGTEGAFGGLGVLVGIRENILTVLKPLPKSPAVKLGIKKHDKIVSIDGFNTFGLTLDKLVNHMRGEPGTDAQLVTLRPGDWSPRTINLRREIIEVDSVETHEHHDKDLHVLRMVVENFASRTSKEIIEHIKLFRKKYNTGGVVLDLRGNPGGLLDQAVMVSDIFLDQGVVVSTKGRREEIERATKSFDDLNFPLAVLMDEDSASASEIVAGALQDNGRAVIIGQPSFGKGSVQTVFELPEQRALKLTIARYFTPNQKSIQNIGIIPDVWIQPIIKGRENLNLLGPFRYRNEQFLPNHLSAVSTTQVGQVPTVKGYFLRHVDANELKSEVDPEMGIAMTMFRKLKDTYGMSFPETARRSSHWLAIAMPDIKEKLTSMSVESIRWLAGRHAVSWKMGVSPQLEKPQLAMQIKTPSDGIPAVAGGKVDIPWRVTNLSVWDADNVSVFVQSPISGLETREFLVGTVPAGQFREGVLTVSIPKTMSPGRHYVNAGIAIDAQALPNAQGEFLVNVSDKPRSSLAATVQFFDGESGKVARTLEANERGTVRVTILNPGDDVAKNVSLNVVSFGGEQIQIPKTSYSLADIAPGSSASITIPVNARDHIESNVIVLGFSLAASNNFDNYFTVSEIATHGREARVPNVEKLSH